MKCCICGKEMVHPFLKQYRGNNPWPVDKTAGARCCDECNATYVIPKRMKLMLGEKKS